MAKTKKAKRATKPSIKCTRRDVTGRRTARLEKPTKRTARPAKVKR